MSGIIPGSQTLQLLNHKTLFFLLLPNLKWFCCFVKSQVNYSKLKPSEGTVIYRSDSCSFYITMFLSGLGCLSLSLCVSLYLDNTFKSQMTYKVCLMLAASFLSCSVACLWCASQSSHSHCRCSSEDWKNSTLDGGCGQPSSSSIHGAIICVWPWQAEREVVPLNWVLFRLDSGHSSFFLVCACWW